MTNDLQRAQQAILQAVRQTATPVVVRATRGIEAPTQSLQVTGDMTDGSVHYFTLDVDALDASPDWELE